MTYRLKPDPLGTYTLQKEDRQLMCGWKDIMPLVTEEKGKEMARNLQRDVIKL